MSRFVEMLLRRLVFGALTRLLYQAFGPVGVLLIALFLLAGLVGWNVADPAHRAVDAAVHALAQFRFW